MANTKKKRKVSVTNAHDTNNWRVEEIIDPREWYMKKNRKISTMVRNI